MRLRSSRACSAAARGCQWRTSTARHPACPPGRWSSAAAAARRVGERRLLASAPPCRRARDRRPPSPLPVRRADDGHERAARLEQRLVERDDVVACDRRDGLPRSSAGHTGARGRRAPSGTRGRRSRLAGLSPAASATSRCARRRSSASAGKVEMQQHVGEDVERLRRTSPSSTRSRLTRFHHRRSPRRSCRATAAHSRAPLRSVSSCPRSASPP